MLTAFTGLAWPHGSLARLALEALALAVLSLSHYIGMGSIGTDSGPGWLALGLIGFGLGWHWTWLAWSWLALDLVDLLWARLPGWLWAGLAFAGWRFAGLPWLALGWVGYGAFSWVGLVCYGWSGHFAGLFSFARLSWPGWQSHSWCMLYHLDPSHFFMHRCCSLCMRSHTPQDSSSQEVYGSSLVQETVSVCWKT